MIAGYIRGVSVLASVVLLLGCTSPRTSARDASTLPAPHTSSNAALPTDVPAPAQPDVLVFYYGQRRHSPSSSGSGTANSFVMAPPDVAS